MHAYQRRGLATRPGGGALFEYNYPFHAALYKLKSGTRTHDACTNDHHVRCSFHLSGPSGRVIHLDLSSSGWLASIQRR